MIPNHRPASLFFFALVLITAPAGAGNPPFAGEPGDRLALPFVSAGRPMATTLKEAVATALANNHDIVIEKITAEISRTQIGQEEGVFDPVAKARIANTRTDTENAAGTSTLAKAYKGSGSLTKRFFPGTSLALSYDTADNREPATAGRYQSNLKVSITQDLLKGFGTDINRAKIRIAQKGVARAGADFDQKVADTVADVQEAYWDLYKSKETLGERTQSFQRTRTLLEKKRIEAQLGAIATVELLEIEAEVATQITEFTEASKQFRDDEIKLRTLLALPIEFGPGSERLHPSTAPAFRPQQFDPERIVSRVLSRHPTYQGILREKEAKEMETAYSKNQMLPALQAKADFGLQNQAHTWNRSAKAFDGGENFEIALEMSLPLGNRAARAAWRKRGLELKKIEARLRKKEDDIRQAIARALVAVEQSASLVRTARAGVRIKEKNLTAAEKKLTFGTSTLRSLLDRQTDLVDARLKQLEAEVDYQKALVGLFKARGMVDPGLDVVISRPPTKAR